MRKLLGLCVALTLVACNNSPEAQPPTKPAPMPTPSATVADTPAPTSAPTPARSVEEPTPDPITHPCVVAAAQYVNAIKDGSDSCKSDADCACYQGGIGKGSGCGGVLNGESVKKLDGIAKRFHDMKCPLTQHCAAWACQPRCDSGHCKR